MARVKAISFDLDGTLINYRFVDSVWFKGIPRLYSVKKRVSFYDAKKVVKREYDKVGKERPEWYDLHYWIRKFGLNITPQELLRYFEHRIKTYPEVPKVLDELKQRGFKLIIVTNARREFVELELRKAEIENYFDRVFSSTSDFGLVKKTADLYERVCSILEIPPQEMIHVGDDQNFDFDVPRRLGIMAFHLDRKGKHKGELIVHSLEELNKKLQRLRE
ncbi:MAG: putative HAD-hydrolase [Candidatus Bathyarchaeota archaeon BA2]|nr:MAG: putative HAD-hydrolase [Candidatus Bathyarchaeota archaeon BA2]